MLAKVYCMGKSLFISILFEAPKKKRKKKIDNVVLKLQDLPRSHFNFKDVFVFYFVIPSMKGKAFFNLRIIQKQFFGSQLIQFHLKSSNLAKHMFPCSCQV